MTDHEATPAEGPLRLAHFIRRRRQALGLSQSEAHRGAGVARNTWITAETGERQIRDGNYAAIERVLAWTTGSVKTILDGGEPAEGLPPSGRTAIDEISQEIDRIYASTYSPELQLQMLRVQTTRLIEVAYRQLPAAEDY